MNPGSMAVRCMQPDLRDGMSRAALLLLACALLACLVLPVSGSSDALPAMVVSYSVNPQVLSPGGLGTITFNVQQVGTMSYSQRSGDKNNYISRSGPATVTIQHITLEENGIVVLSPDYDRVGQIGPGRPLQVTFVIRAPDKSGIFYPEIWMDTDAGSSRYPIPVNVNTPIGIQKQAIIVMQSEFPQTVNAGDEIPVNITLRNEGGMLAERLILGIGNTSTGVAPKTSGTYYLGTIPPAEERKLGLVLLSDEDASPGLVRIPVNLQYTTIDGKIRNETAFMNVVLQGQGDLGITAVGTRPVRVIANQPFELAMTIENTGSGPARQVEAAIDLPLTGTRQVYIGKIMPDGEASVLFQSDGGREGIYAYNATVTYTDDAGSHTRVQKLSLHVTSDPISGMLVPAILLVIIGGMAAFFVYWNRRQNRGGAAAAPPDRKE